MTRKRKRSERPLGQQPSGSPADAGLPSALEQKITSGDPSRGVYYLVVALFLASGLSSLIYQVVWTRMLVLVFGSTTYATATVLAIFMGGLSLGAWLAGRFAHRVRSPLLWYGGLEAVIGIWAILAPFLFTLAAWLYSIVWSATGSNLAIFSVLRILVAALILLPPTTCMGASLPLLSNYVNDSFEEIGKRTGTLYSINTFGAILGAGLGGLVLLPAIGLTRSTMIAAAINIALFLVVLPLWMRSKRSSETVLNLSTPQPTESEQSAQLSKRARIAIIGFAISGGIAMIYEVCWTRALLLLVGSSTYAFTIMLCSFLTGIFLGSFICAKYIDRVKQPLLLFAILQVGIAILSSAAMYAFTYVPLCNIWLYSLSINNDTWYLVCKLILCSALLVPFTCCLGATFPAVVRGCTPDLAKVGRSTGDIYAANTVGAIVGALIAGFWLIPDYGVEKSLAMSIAGTLMVGALTLFVCTDMTLPTRAVASLCILLSGAGWLALPQKWDPMMMAYSQVYLLHMKELPIPTSYKQWFTTLKKNGSVIFYKDGPCSSVAVLEFGTQEHPARSIATNGHIDGSDTGDRPTQALVAAFPLLLKPDARDVAVVGWGVGMSVGTASLFPVQSIDAIELEPAVVEASNLFHHINYAPEENSKVHIHFNDGRNFLLLNKKQYDVIISEPSNPWQSGVCNLFTKEYMRICKARLKPGGVFSLWLQLGQVSPSNVAGILSALKQSFPHTMVVLLNSSNVAVLASDAPLSMRPQSLRKALTIEPLRKELANYYLTTPEAIIARLLVTDAGVSTLAAGARPNSDDNNFLEFSIARSYETARYFENEQKLLETSKSRVSDDVDFSGLNAKQQAELSLEIARAALTYNFFLGNQWLGHSLALYPEAKTVELIRRVRVPSMVFTQIDQLCTAHLHTDKQNTDTLKARALARLALGRIAESRSDLETVLHIAPTDKEAQFYMGQTFAKNEPGLGEFTAGSMDHADDQAMLKWFSPLLQDEQFVKAHPDILFGAADVNFRLGNTKQALTLMTRYKQRANETAAACRLLGVLYYQLGMRTEGAAFMQRSFQLAQREAQNLLNRLSDGFPDTERLPMYETVLQIDPLNENCANALENMKEPRAVELLNQLHRK